MPRIIEVTVSPRGETTVQTKGYAGGDCLAASRFLEQALGVAAADRKTAEFYQEQPADQALKQSRGPPRADTPRREEPHDVRRGRRGRGPGPRRADRRGRLRRAGRGDRRLCR